MKKKNGLPAATDWQLYMAAWKVYLGLWNLKKQNDFRGKFTNHTNQHPAWVTGTSMQPKQTLLVSCQFDHSSKRLIIWGIVSHLHTQAFSIDFHFLLNYIKVLLRFACTENVSVIVMRAWVLPTFSLILLLLLPYLLCTTSISWVSIAGTKKLILYS